VAYLTSLGVPAHRIIVGHCCGSSDRDYLQRILDAGAYVGLDRFGNEFIRPDTKRVELLLGLAKSGARDQIIISHDSSCCVYGQVAPAALFEALEKRG
jgi:phosphotriesterase-related protein